MGARSGSNYLSSLKKLNAELRLGGERVAEITSHPAFRNCARSVASLYDMQLERVEQMTYRTDDGGRAGLSFIQPKSIEELRKRSRMMATWANFSGGMLAHTPDNLNAGIAAMAAARDFFASDPRYGDNIANYYLEARKHDWCATHSFINSETQIVGRDAAGITVNGSGMLAPLAPFAEELIVFPSPSLNDESHALAFAIPCNTKGLKFICDANLDAQMSSGSRFDAPLASRFTQHDCLIFFDHVTVPWERVFLCGDIARCNALLDETSARIHMIHQAVIKNVAKAEFMLGLAARLAEVTDTMTSPHIPERIAEIISVTETMRECLRAAEADAASDQWGIVVPARAPLEKAQGLFERIYPRAVEAVQFIGGPDLIAPPSQNDFPNADTDARERAALYHLAWDATRSAFAGRQTPSERADVVDMASAPADTTDLRQLTQRIKDFLNRTD